MQTQIRNTEHPSKTNKRQEYKPLKLPVHLAKPREELKRPHSQTKPKEKRVASQNKSADRRYDFRQYFEVCGIDTYLMKVNMLGLLENRHYNMLTIAPKSAGNVKNIQLGDIYKFFGVIFPDSSTFGLDSLLNDSKNAIFFHIDIVENLTIVATKIHPLDIDYQLYGLILPLKDGWYDGAGTAYAKSDLEWVGKLLKSAMPEELERPAIVPTPDAEMMVEWSFKNLVATLTIPLNDMQNADWTIYSLDDSIPETEAIIDLTTDEPLKIALTNLLNMLPQKG
jgi:hypothetical protein